MIGLLSLAATLLVAAAPSPPGAPASGAEIQELVSGHMEVVVVETPDCAYCKLFRSRVLPADEASPQIRDVPVRFIDASGLNDGGVTLSGPVDVVPTTILVRDGIELGRISGYVGRENFFRSINYLMAKSR